MSVVVRRSAARMWLMSIGAIPLLVISVDILTSRKITKWLQDIVFVRPEDLQIYEPRDVIWAWGLLLFSAAVIAWGLKELFFPTKIVECTSEGLAVKVSGPFRPTSLIPWAHLSDVDAFIMYDDEARIPLLRLVLVSRGELPTHPWGGRWLEERTLGLLAQDWDAYPTEIATEIQTYVSEVAEIQARERTASLWEEN